MGSEDGEVDPGVAAKEGQEVLNEGLGPAVTIARAGIALEVGPEVHAIPLSPAHPAFSTAW